MVATLTIQKAVKEQAKIRLCLAGPAGAGKTFSSLSIGVVLAQAEGSRMLVIDTESGRASKYAHLFDFDTIKLPRFAPALYVEALTMAAQAGYKVVIIDSLSHEWNGEGGALEMASGNFNNWKTVTPEHQKLMNAIQRYPGHVLATLRSHVEYASEQGANGKQQITRLGTKPIQRDGVDFEFDLYGMMDRQHRLSVEKSILIGYVGVNDVIERPGKELAEQIIAWSRDGAPQSAPVAEEREKAPAPDLRPAPLAHQPAPPPTAMPPNGLAHERQVASIRKLCTALRRDEPDFATLTFNDARELLTELSRAYSEQRRAG